MNKYNEETNKWSCLKSNKKKDKNNGYSFVLIMLTERKIVIIVNMKQINKQINK